MAEQQIKAVAEAINEASDEMPWSDRYAQKLAKAAIAAMPVREMTAEEVAKVLAEPYVNRMKAHYIKHGSVYEVIDDFKMYLESAQALAKLGAIRIVEAGSD